MGARPPSLHLLDDWFDPIEAGLGERVREFIQAMIESELEAALVRPRYGRRPKADAKNGNGPSGISGHRHGHRSRSLMGTFGRVEIAVPRARLDTAEGKDSRVEEQGAASLSAANQAGRCADCPSQSNVAVFKRRCLWFEIRVIFQPEASDAVQFHIHARRHSKLMRCSSG